MQNQKNTARYIAVLAMFVAVSFVSVLISKVIPNVAGFLSYEPKDALIVIAGFIGMKNGRVRYSGDVYNSYPLFWLSAFGSIIGYLLMARVIEKNRVLEYVGASTMAILVMHKFPVLFFQTIVPQTRKLLADNNLPVALIVAVIAIAMCLIAERIILLICPALVGKKKEK